MKAIPSVVFLLVGFASHTAHACSCVERSTAQEFARSDIVVSARIVNRKTSVARMKYAGPKPVPVEHVSLTVLKVWKGSSRPGDTITVRNVIENPPQSSCADKNTLNIPQWVRFAGQPSASSVAELLDVWLIYDSGKAPFRFQACSKSIPLSWAEGELAELDRLSGKPVSASPAKQ